MATASERLAAWGHSPQTPNADSKSNPKVPTLLTLKTLPARRARNTATRGLRLSPFGRLIPASCHRPWSCPSKSPDAGHDSRARFGRPRSVLIDPTWRENSRSEIRPRRRRRVARGEAEPRSGRQRPSVGRANIPRARQGESPKAMATGVRSSRRESGWSFAVSSNHNSKRSSTHAGNRPPRPAGAMSQFRGRRPPKAENRARQLRSKLV